MACDNVDRCCQIFAKTIDHVESVINDFAKAKGLNLDDIERGAYCPAVHCKNVLNMEKVLKDYQKDFNPELEIKCEENENHSILVKDLFPDMLLADAPELMLPPCISKKLEINGDLENGIKGGFGTVYKKDQTLSLCGDSDPEKIAIKVLKKSMASETKRHIDMRNEALLMSKLADHPYILTFFGMAFKQLPKNNKGDEKSPWMVMELANDGDLKHQIKGKHFDRVLLYRIAFQIADALTFMHSLNIYHRDLHPGNVLVFSEDITKDTNVKIADFGLSCHAVPHKGLQSGIGSPKYHPPELFNYFNSIYDQSVDIYAYGLIMYYILTLQEPFNGILPIDIKSYKKTNEAHEGIFKYDQVRADAICLKNVMKWCKAFDLKDRDINSHCITILLQNSCFQLLQTSVPLTITVNSSINVGQSNRSQATEYSVPIIISDTDRDAVDVTLNMLMTVNESKKRRVRFSTPGVNPRYIMSYARNNSHVVIVKQFVSKYYLADVSTSCNPNYIIDIKNAKEHNGIAEQIQITNIENSIELFLLEVVGNEGTIKRCELESSNSPSPGPVERPINDLYIACTKDIMQGHWGNGQSIKSFAVCVEGKFLVVAFARKIVILTFGESRLAFLDVKYDFLELGDELFEIKRIYLHQHSTGSEMSGHADSGAGRDGTSSVCNGGDESSNMTRNNNKKRCVLVVVGRDSAKITFVPIIFELTYFVPVIFGMPQQVYKVYKFDHDHIQIHNLNSKVSLGRVNITSFCPVGDTFWFGAQSGVIYIVGYKQNSNSVGDDDGNNGMGDLFQVVIKPYTSTVKQLVYIAAGTNTINDRTNKTIIPKGVLSYGDSLNADAFNFNEQRRNAPKITNSKANLTRTFLEQKRNNVPEYHASDLLLLWQAPTSLELDRFRMERAEGRETNEKLQKIRDHSEFFLFGF